MIGCRVVNLSFVASGANFMNPFLSAVTDLIVSAGIGNDLEEVYTSARQVMEEAAGADPEDWNNALERLHDAIVAAPVPCLGVLGITAGALVEHGGSPDMALSAVLERLPEVLLGAADFAAACRQAAGEETEGEAIPEDTDDPDEDTDKEEQADPVDQFGPQVAAQMPDTAGAWNALDALGLGVIAMLSRSVDGRRQARENQELLEGLAAVGEAHPRIGWLNMLLSVLDGEELLVLHPGEKRGYRVRIRGLADNFQLHTLLADALIGKPSQGWLSGRRPDPLVVAAARDRPVHPSSATAEGAFNLWNWTGLQADGALPEGMGGSDDWIWNEGMPADIVPFEGRRIVLLGPPAYPRTWNAGRRFDGMVGELTVLEKLPAAAVADWLARLAVAAAAHRAAPGSSEAGS
jgi:hypothetical protein